MDLDHNNKAKYLANVLSFDKVSRLQSYKRREGMCEEARIV